MIPIDFILNIILSQTFFMAAQYIIEFCKNLIERGISTLYNKMKYKTSTSLRNLYIEYIRPLIMASMFIIFGIIVSSVLSKYNKNKKEKELSIVKHEINNNNDITPENIFNLLKNYIKYYEIIGKN